MSVVEQVHPYCGDCGHALLAPYDPRPLRDRTGPVLAGLPCGCGKVLTAEFWRVVTVSTEHDATKPLLLRYDKPRCYR